MIPQDGDIRIFFYALDVSTKTLAQYVSFLNKEEKLRAQSFRFQIHRDRFVAGRGVLRSILGLLGGCPPQAVEFAYSRYGKPDIIAPLSLAQLGFSVSNSEGTGAVAVGQFAKLGLDIEHFAINTRPEVEVSRMLAESERVWLSLQQGASNQAFYELWTCKEAYLKARGDGLHEPLNGFSVSMECVEKPTLTQGLNGDNAGEWSFRQIDAGEQLAGCLVVQGELLQVSIERWKTRL